MDMRFRNLMGALAIALTSTSVLASGAIAQTDFSNSQPVRLETVPDVFERAFFNDSGDFYRNRSFVRQSSYFLGTGSPTRPGFPESEDYRDAKAVNTLYRQLMYEQVSSDPIIRTPDLPNPYNTSIRALPSLRSNNRVVGSEFNYERIPMR